MPAQPAEQSLEVPINVALNDDLRKRIAEKIFYFAPGITRFEFAEFGLHIAYTCREGEPAPDGVRLCSFIDEIVRTAGRAKTSILRENLTSARYSGDPYRTLVDKEEVAETLPGVFLLRGDFQRRFELLDRLFREHAYQHGADEQLTPTTLPVTSLIANGYLSDFPHHAIFAAPIRHDLTALEQIAALPSGDGAGLQSLRQTLAPPQQVLAPTVCYHCFEAMRERKDVRNGAVLTALGHCHRFESKNLTGLMRLQHFRMREIIFLGRSQFVTDGLDGALNFIADCLSEWNITYRIVTATDPFFLGASERKAAYQSAFALKRELQLHIPHANAWVACGSFNNHKGVILAKYGIEIADTNDAASGCVGYGYERFLYALYSQLGFHAEAWPAPLRPSN